MTNIIAVALIIVGFSFAMSITVAAISICNTLDDIYEEMKCNDGTRPR